MSKQVARITRRIPQSVAETLQMAIAIANDDSLGGLMIRDTLLMISSRHWDHFLTLTFRTDVSEIEATKEFEEAFIRRLQQRSQGWIRYIAVAAKGHPFGRVHIHAVLRYSQPLPISESQAAWRRGLSKIGIYDPNRGGRFYLAKHVALPNSEFMLSLEPPTT